MNPEDVFALLLVGFAMALTMIAAGLVQRTRHYLSSACFHGLHHQCAGSCAFCDRSCRCMECKHP